MPKKAFFRSMEFRIFLTAWLIYIFYLQMYGSSCMANSNSALAASIINEGRFEVDTYYRASCDLAFYNSHYYSGLAPGISFISAPLYAAGKVVLEPLPPDFINYAYEKIDSYGKSLPADFYGNKKSVSHYFPGLTRKEVVQHLIISTFLLPPLTTALFSAISVALIYSILKYFTKRKRVLITVFYGFGTLLFPLSTEFFQRELALALALASFLILLKIKHKELSAKKAVFAAGLLAGLSIWFDYYHAVLLILFGIYLAYILSLERGKISLKKIFAHGNFLLLLKFSVGALIPIILLMGYHYAAFDNPFVTAYKYRTTVDYRIDIGKMPFPSAATIIRLFEFFIYSPIMIFAAYGLFQAIRKKDERYPEAIGTLVFFILTFIYATSLAILYQSFMPSSHKRYMLPVVPYLMLFLPYVFSAIRKKKMLSIIIAVGIISIFFNWTAAQFGGHSSLVQFDLSQNKFIAGADFLKAGPSSSLIRTLSGALGLSFIQSLLINILALLALISLIWLIWRKPYRQTRF